MKAREKPCDFESFKDSFAIATSIYIDVPLKPPLKLFRNIYCKPSNSRIFMDLPQNLQKKPSISSGFSSSNGFFQGLGFKTAVISGGFLPVAREAARYDGLSIACGLAVDGQRKKW